MACCLFGAKPLPYRVIVYWTLRNKLQWNFDKNTTIFINEKSSAKWRPFCPGGNELIYIQAEKYIEIGTKKK